MSPLIDPRPLLTPVFSAEEEDLPMPQIHQELQQLPSLQEKILYLMRLQDTVRRLTLFLQELETKVRESWEMVREEI